MTRKEYLHQLAQEIAQEIISMNQPLIDRIVTAEVDKIKFQLASLAPNMAAMRSEMLAVMGSNSSLGVYLANVDKLQADKSDIATNAFTAPQQAPNPREYFGNEITDSFTRQYFDGDPVFNAAIDEYFNGPKEFRDQLDNYFYMGE
ncbi:hypothetical protein [Escherichia coli]|uniref:Uncharacterized protein n=2 Tax=Escherichia coli TaxID=562 RepID=A0AAI9E655_ECOLX|nr:hypothetical protein [Escherichia coli]EFF9741886.1 hypothetical protein [Escherichia coli]EFG7260085.1 hypothetical protein [Escherichia coli]EHW5760561.1 hypothetical protein [Escherichia coli]EJZ9677517.1 hypothetical protein [Escherichia coli]EKV4496195.1 hypothetical protein [Escherichia coli]